MSEQLSDEDATAIAIKHLIVCVGKSGGASILHRAYGRLMEFFPYLDSYDSRELAIRIDDRLVIFRAHEVK